MLTHFPAHFYNISSNYTSDVSATSLPLDVLCSPCVLSMYQMFQQTAYSYYDDSMAADWANIHSKCGVSYPTSVPENPTNVTNIPGFAPPGAATATATCFSGNRYTVAPGDNCNDISQQLNVSTGALQIPNNIFPDCSNLIGTLPCFPDMLKRLCSLIMDQRVHHFACQAHVRHIRFRTMILAMALQTLTVFNLRNLKHETH